MQNINKFIKENINSYSSINWEIQSITEANHLTDDPGNEQLYFIHLTPKNKSK